MRMNAIENLRAFIESAEQSGQKLSPEQRERLGNDLVQAADTREGYEELVWQAGMNLVFSLEQEEEVEDFFQRYGYRAIASALFSTFINGDFPIGLGFIVNGFVLDDDLSTLANRSEIREALAMLEEERVRVPIENFVQSSSLLRRASRQFLSRAREAGLSASICLQIAASLLAATPEDDQEREPVTRTFLDALLAENRDISLFYCWRAAIEQHQALASEPSYLKVLPDIIKQYRAMDDRGIVLLKQLLSNGQLIDGISKNENLSTLSIIIGLAGWWLSVRKGREGQEVEIAQQFLLHLGVSSPLYKALINFLISKQSQSASSRERHRQLKSEKEIVDLQREFQEVMQRLSEEVRLRTYRGVPLAIQIWRDNLIRYFEPLCEELGGFSALSQKTIQQIQGLDAQSLLDDNPLQREARYQPIEGKLRGNMIKDFETIVKLLQRALDLRLQLSDRATVDQEAAELLTREDVKREVSDLCKRDPALCWAIEWFLPETISARSVEASGMNS